MNSLNLEIVTEPSLDDAESIVILKEETWYITYPFEGTVNGKHIRITLDDLKARFVKRTREEAIERQKKYLLSENSKTWVVKDGRRVVGWGVASKENEEHRVQALYVHPDFHGKKYGAALMLTALSWLGTENEILVNVLSYNNRAIEFYSKFAFEPVKEVEDEAGRLPSGAILPELEMIRKLK